MDYCTLVDKSEEEEQATGDSDQADAEVVEADKPDVDETKTDGDDNAEGHSVTVLVLQESAHRSVWAYQVQSKGASEAWVVDQILEDLDTIGLRNDRVVVKSDQEPSAQEVSRAIAHGRAADYGTAIEASAVGASDTNASVKRAIQDVEGQIRTLRSALEERVAAKINISAPVVPWLIRHAACLITRCRVRPDGQTAMQKIRGRQPISKVAELGETVHFKIPKTKHMPGKFEDAWSEVIWLVFEMRTSDHLIGTNVGVFRATSVMRKP